MSEQPKRVSNAKGSSNKFATGGEGLGGREDYLGELNAKTGCL